MIRRAVGAIVFQRDEVLLVHKVKRSEVTGGLDSFQAEWDFPKGGVKEGEPLEDAILRELYEETGSTSYKLIKQLDQNICFSFDEHFTSSTGYVGQVTTMFIVEYIGDRSELKSQDEEISAMQFVHKKHVLDYLAHEETRALYKKHSDIIPE